MNIMIMKCGCAANGTCHAMGGVKYDPPIPSCVIHDCIEPADEQPDLLGRMANCAYGAHAIRPSDPDKLAFFEYRGPGSPWATAICKCGYSDGAHEKEGFVCKAGGFTPRGPHERDLYYCGCRGWD